jgi:hypothetical protein
VGDTGGRVVGSSSDELDDSSSAMTAFSGNRTSFWLVLVVLSSAS